MKVLSILESVSRADGGIFEAEFALQRELALSQGCSVNVVALRDEFTHMDIDKWLPIQPGVARVVGPKGIGLAPGLGRLMDGEVDLAYCAALWKYPSWAVLEWQNKTGKPVVLAPHGSLDSWALRNSRWKKRIAAWFFKDRQLHNATCLRALCESEVNAMRAYGLRQRIEVVPNGVALPEMQNGECERRNSLGRRRLLFLGRIPCQSSLIVVVFLPLLLPPVRSC